ncbi:hypothetical protein EC973_004026 [Apophysomyces ossiformis]|uniref:C2H2-type domain-containing protein n=1 Tax=Apophysomyces ossiformis TaxID=679940 RepID=A0A8H7BZU4_9FUNG|nr:hypothetical protein EC973_004026 [Apophysomyces ossiformis]
MSAASQPHQPRSTLFTCLACHIAFPTSDRQRAHYRTDLHKYNLKRKLVDLAPITAEQFVEKVLAQQAKGREEQERQGLIYECSVCRKSYFSENAFHNHVQSKKHKELELRLASEKTTDRDDNHRQREVQLFSDPEDDAEKQVASSMPSSLSSNSQVTPLANPVVFGCLFCNHFNDDFDTSLLHMAHTHGFFLPDAEYLVDVHGLINYLSEKIQARICLYCNGRGREWKTVEAVRAHMIDKGHCKMAYDDSEDPDQLLRFYDFEPLEEEDGVTEKGATANGSELVLENGARLGHRRDLRLFKQRLSKRATTKAIAEAAAIEMAAEKEEALADPSLNRKEKRRLLLTDGRTHNETIEQTLEGIREAAKKQEFYQSVALKHNLTNTRRIRTQNPI